MGVHVTSYTYLMNKGNNFSNGYIAMHVGMALAMASYVHTKVAGLLGTVLTRHEGLACLGTLVTILCILVDSLSIKCSKGY